jgi:hypothetical protein
MIRLNFRLISRNPIVFFDMRLSLTDERLALRWMITGLFGEIWVGSAFEEVFLKSDFAP